MNYCRVIDVGANMLGVNLHRMNSLHPVICLTFTFFIA